MRKTRRPVIVQGWPVIASAGNFDNHGCKNIPKAGRFLRKTGQPVIAPGGVGNALKTLRDQYNAQFPLKPLLIEKWRTEQHDRWLIVDDELWHCGASIRDAGVRTFGIDLIGLDVNIILGQV